MTTSEKYIQLKEGKITQKQFLEYVRKEPNLKGVITSLQSFDDTVRVLKNRKYISESIGSHRVDKAVRSAMAELEGKEDITDEIIGDLADKWSEYYDLDTKDAATVSQTLISNLGGNEEIDENEEDDFGYSSDFLDPANKKIDREIDDEEGIEYNLPYDEYTDTIQNILRDRGADDDSIISIFDSYPKLIQKGFDAGQSPEDLIRTLFKLSHDISDQNELNEGFFNPEYDEETFKIDNLNPNQVTDGTKYEYKKQKIKDFDKAKALAIKNILKDPIYYTNLLAGIKLKKKRTDLPIELDKKFSNTKDKSNEEKKSPDATTYTASANKATKEIQKIPTYKEDTFNAQRVKGIKGMDELPGKEKKIKLSEIQKLASIISNIIKEELDKSKKK